MNFELANNSQKVPSNKSDIKVYCCVVIHLLLLVCGDILATVCNCCVVIGTFATATYVCVYVVVQLLLLYTCMR